MVLDQIQCPKKGNNKMGVNVFAKKWLPEMEKYAIDYVGLGDLTGTTSNKEAKKATIGTNKFVKLSGKCGIASDAQCVGKDKYMYFRSYPMGYTPTCIKKDGKYITSGKNPIIGGTGLLGGIQEDLYTLNLSDYAKAIVKQGPFASTDCMYARLPVGDGLLLGGRRFDNKEDVELNGRGWYVEEQCVPRQPTFDKNYGGEIFKIPFSESRCKEEFTQKSETRTIPKYIYILLVFGLLILSLISTKYNKKTGKVCVSIGLKFMSFCIIKCRDIWDCYWRALLPFFLLVLGYYLLLAPSKVWVPDSSSSSSSSSSSDSDTNNETYRG